MRIWHSHGIMPPHSAFLLWFAHLQLILGDWKDCFFTYIRKSRDPLSNYVSQSLPMEYICNYQMRMRPCILMRSHEQGATKIQKTRHENYKNWRDILYGADYINCYWENIIRMCGLEVGVVQNNNSNVGGYVSVHNSSWRANVQSCIIRR